MLLRSCKSGMLNALLINAMAIGLIIILNWINGLIVSRKIMLDWRKTLLLVVMAKVEERRLRRQRMRCLKKR